MITGLRQYALAVPDHGVADTSVRGFGLWTADHAGALVGRCPSGTQEQVRMIDVPVKRLHHVAFDQSGDCWVARDRDVPPHLWGSPPPEDFLVNREPTR